MDEGLSVLLLIAFIVVAIVVTRLRQPPRPKFDSERRELRYGRGAPIPFRDLEVRVFRYRQEEDPETKSGIQGGIWGAMAAGTEELHRVYVRADHRRVDLKEFGSAEDAEQYANEIREMIADA